MLNITGKNSKELLAYFQDKISDDAWKAKA